MNLLANIVAKLGNIVGGHVKFDMFANNVGQFGHTFSSFFNSMYPGNTKFARKKTAMKAKAEKDARREEHKLVV